MGTLRLVSLAASLIILASVGSILRFESETVSASNRPTPVRAEGKGYPWINLRDARQLKLNYRSHSTGYQLQNHDLVDPLYIASADLDEDGVPDLVCGFAADRGGKITLHRGNLFSIYPNQPGADQVGRDPFFASAVVFDLPEPPDFLATGDFDADGHPDIVAASRGGRTLHLLAGDGKGAMLAARSIELQGAVTSLTAGEINRRDGLADLIVGIAEDAGPKALVFEGPGGALTSQPEAFALPAEATDLALEYLNDDYSIDLAVAAGNELVIIEGRDRRLSLDSLKRARVADAEIMRVSLPFRISSLAAGDFITEPGYRAEIALLAEDGSLHMLERTASGAIEAQVTLTQAGKPQREWTITQEISISQVEQHVSGKLVKARVSSVPGENLLVVDRSNRKVHMITGEPGRGEGGGLQSSVEPSRPRLAASLEAASEPVAVLPMRLNSDGLNDLVILQKGQSEPSLVMSAPVATYVVVSNGFEADCDTNDGMCAIDGSPMGGCQPTGPCTIRAAIQQANASAGADMIAFSIGSGQQTIVSTLGTGESIIETVTIDGTTQPGFAGTPIIELDGGAPTSNTDTMLTIGQTTTSSVVRGLVINRLTGGGGGGRGSAISIDSSSGLRPTFNIVEGNFLGTDVTGTATFFNVGNPRFGVHVEHANNNTIGGTTTAARNIIAGHNVAGVGLVGGGGSSQGSNVVKGNFIGTDVTGTVKLPNGCGASSFEGGIQIGSDNNVIGGTGAGDRNIISGGNFLGIGVMLNFQNTLIQGNLIGTDVNGAASLSNIEAGIQNHGVNTTIGGTTPTARNLISGNDGHGILLVLSATDNTLIQGNFIGTDISGGLALPNGEHGVFARQSRDDTIGGTAAGAGNVIAFNSGAGVAVDSNSLGTQGIRNAILGNSIFSNVGLGIDLSRNSTGVGGDGVTPNDTGDGDGGGNTFQNFPVITAVTAGSINISGTLNSTASTQFRLEFFSSPQCDASGNGEGQTFIGSTNVTTDGSGNASFMVNFPNNVPAGSAITATATDPLGNTSEFSACAQVSCVSGCTASSPGTGTVGSPLQFSSDATLDCPASLAFDWDFGDGSPNSSLQNPSHIYSTPGFYNWRFTVSIGGSPVCTRTGTISIAPTVPVITSFSPSGGPYGTTVTISGLNFNGATVVTFNGLSASFILDSPSQITATVPTGATTGPISVQTPAGTAVSPTSFVIGTVRITVTSNLDNNIRDNLLTLREAILIANGSLPKAALSIPEQALVVGAPTGPSLDEIRFSIGSGPQTISPTSPLDTITGPVMINATTQPGFAGNPIIELNGTNAGPAASGLKITAGGSAARGLVINRFSADGIRLQSLGGNLIAGNFIGTDITGNSDQGNGGHGVNILNSSNNVIGGTTASSRNVISGNGRSGVSIVGDLNEVQGNFIGVGLNGATPIGNDLDGVSFFGNNNTIGARLNPDGSLSAPSISRLQPDGTASGPGNIIAYNATGVRGVAKTSGGDSTGNSVLSNLIFSNQNDQIQLQAPCPSADCPTLASANAGLLTPVLDSVTLDQATGIMTITGMVSGAPNTNYYMQFFNFDMCSGGMPSGTPQSLTSLPILQRTDSFGSASFTLMIQVSGMTNGWVNATATDPQNNTSPFSICAQINSGCSFSIVPDTLSYPPGGGINGVSVLAQSGCNWTATSNNPDFITITSGSNGSGFGNVLYTVAPNSTMTPRTGTMTVAGQTFTVTQNAQSCSFMINPANQNFNSEGGPGSVNVTAGAGCNWTAVSNNPEFITITSPTSGGGSGNGMVSFIVSASAGSPRAGTMTIAGQTFTVTQDSGCSYAIDVLSQSFSANADTGIINVTAGEGCAWTAVSSCPGFVTITSGSNGSGIGTVTYSITANSSTIPRSCTITVAGFTFTVLQGALFNDVQPGSPFFNEIGKLSARGVTLGCNTGLYCPDDVVTRQQMAAFIIRALGMPNPPVPPSQRFADVPPSNPFYAFIEQMAIRQITLGCGGGNYCPSQPVLREQMAAFIIRGLGEFNPPQPAMQRFADVPPSNPFYGFIDRMAVLQITLGCGGGNYCPTQSVTRAQMAAFLVRAFNL